MLFWIHSHAYSLIKHNTQTALFPSSDFLQIIFLNNMLPLNVFILGHFPHFYTFLYILFGYKLHLKFTDLVWNWVPILHSFGKYKLIIESNFVTPVLDHFLGHKSAPTAVLHRVLWNKDRQNPGWKLLLDPKMASNRLAKHLNHSGLKRA